VESSNKRDRGKDAARGTEFHRSMSADDVLSIVDLCEKHGINIWVDGGWAVDALLGEQTRPHDDLDIVVKHEDVSTFRELLDARGYKDRPRDDTTPWNFVLADIEGREIDLHVITFDDQGNGLYEPVEQGASYPAASLTGTGHISGKAAKCISPEWLVKFHAGYELDENDYHDVLALHQRFGVELPKEYRDLNEVIIKEATPGEDRSGLG
jgi:lincosamide nucleotidyltransferase A/C/D/E